MKCANCPNDAAYKLDSRGASVVYYCARCLPLHLQERARDGQLDIPAPAPKKTTKKKVAEEPAVESSEEPTEEEA